MVIHPFCLRVSSFNVLFSWKKTEIVYDPNVVRETRRMNN